MMSAISIMRSYTAATKRRLLYMATFRKCNHSQPAAGLHGNMESCVRMEEIYGNIFCLNINVIIMNIREGEIEMEPYNNSKKSSASEIILGNRQIFFLILASFIISFHFKIFHFFSILESLMISFPFQIFQFSNPCHATPLLPSINHIVHNSHIPIFFGSLHLVMTLISDKNKIHCIFKGVQVLNVLFDHKLLKVNIEAINYK